MLQLRSGNRLNVIEFPEKAEVVILKAEGLPALTNLATEIETILNIPVGHPSDEDAFVSNLVHGQVVIAITDAVLHENLEVVLPSVLAHLCQKDETLKPSAVTIVFDEGIKRSPQASGFKKLYQTVNASGYRVIFHDPILQPMVDRGVTSRGTPVWVNSELANADLKIVIDQIKPSPLFGFVESPLRMARCFMSIDSIESLEAMVQSSSGEGLQLDRHPVFEEMQEITRMVGIDGGLAGISNPTGETIRIMAGEPSMIIRQAAALYRRHYGILVSKSFDIAVISFSSNRPKRLFDSVQDGLLMATHLLKEGGQVLIMGDNTQGIGTDIFFDYVCNFLSPSALIDGFINSRKQFETGGIGQSNRQHAAADRSLEKIFGGGVLRRCQFRAADPSTVLAEWAEEYEYPPRIAVIPDGYGTFCYPE